MAITNTIPITIMPYELEKLVYTTRGGVAETRKPLPPPGAPEPKPDMVDRATYWLNEKVLVPRLLKNKSAIV